MNKYLNEIEKQISFYQKTTNNDKNYKTNIQRLFLNIVENFQDVDKNEIAVAFNDILEKHNLETLNIRDFNKYIKTPTLPTVNILESKAIILFKTPK